MVGSHCKPVSGSFERMNGVKLSPLSDFLHAGEIILVSCCNLGGFGSRYSLAVITSEGISWLDLDDVIDPSSDIGIVGLAATERSCFLAMQGKAQRIVSLGSDLRPTGHFASRRGADLHSLAAHNGSIYAASTGRNQILKISAAEGSFTGGEEVFFTGTPSQKNLIHLNSVCAAGDGLLYSMFGLQCTGARYGAVMDAGTGETVCGRILDPHSLAYAGDGLLAFCESLTSSFCLLRLDGSGELRKAQLAGYTRGCCFTGRHFIVGASRWRHKSRSMGSFREAPASADPHGNPWQRSTLYFLNPDLSVAHQLDFTRCAPEIYDIVFLGARFTAARVFHDAETRRLDAMYDEIHGADRPVSRYHYKRA